jgi:hypothetical protein
MNTYPLTQEDKAREMTIINEILKKNLYQQLPTNFQHQNKVPTDTTQTPLNTREDKTKWVSSHISEQKLEPSVTYFGT